MMLKRCDLPGCEKQGEFLLSDNRVLCGFHAGLFFAGSKVVEKYNNVEREAAEEAIVKPLVDADLEIEGKGEGS